MAAHADPPPPLHPVRAAFFTRDGLLPRPSSVQHWQLRDLVACPRPGGGVFVVRHCSVVRYGLKDGKSTVVLGLPYSPTSMAVDGGLVAAGGQHGQLDVRRLADGAPVLRSSGGAGSVVNGIHLAAGAGAGTAGDGGGGGAARDRVFVATNDACVRVYDVPSAAAAAEEGEEEDGENVPPVRRLGEEEEEEDEAADDDDDDAPRAADPDRAPLSPRPRRHRGRPAPSDAAARAARARAAAPAAVVRALDPVNYAALAPPRGPSSAAAGPAGRLLATVGDCASLALHAPGEDGAYRRTGAWDAFRDAGMACAWSPGGAWLAAAGQCGTVVAVDPRAGPGARPAAQLRVRGAARALKVCPGPADLVLVTEHDARAHVFDARTWNAVHTLRVGGSGAAGPGERGAPLSGAAFSPDGERAYVGIEDGGVAVFGVRSAERCCVAEWGPR